MPRAILKNGVIVSVEPLPAVWGEGTEVDIRREGKEAMRRKMGLP